ncbi:unnamed protein product [Scytosiphon promiscuus]
MPPIFKLAAATATAGAMLALAPTSVSGFNPAPRFSAVSTSNAGGFFSAVSPAPPPAFAAALAVGKRIRRESSRRRPISMTMTETADPQRHHVDAPVGGGGEAAPSQGGKRMAARKVLQAAGTALAWYVASSAAAFAVSSATGGGGGSGAVAAAVRPRRKSNYTGLPILLLAYSLSRKDVKERTRLEGVVPRDPESIKLLADDAEDLAMSWGRPAGWMAYTSVDSIVFLISSRFVGFPYKELSSAASFRSPDFWLASALASAFGFAITTWSRKVGQGYLRSVCASALSPAMQKLFVKPAKTVASVVGMGDGWDLGLTDEARKARRPSIELRKSLSTFQDPDLRGDGSSGDSGGAAFIPPPSSPPPPPPPPPSPGAVDDGGGAPPDLRRSS